MARTLGRYALDEEAQLAKLARIATFTVLIGNADAHGKNLSLLHPTPTNVEIAPLYDTVPTVDWPNLKTHVGMTVNQRNDVNKITRSDLVAEAQSWGLAEAAASTAVDATISDAVQAARTLFTKSHPRRKSIEDRRRLLTQP